MKIAIVGLGSMGKRRIRNLTQIGGCKIEGFDVSEDRINEIKSLGHKAYLFGENQTFEGFDAVIVSTPPDQHLKHLTAAVAARRPVFVEASVILSGLPEVASEAARHGVTVCPSCTMRFHPAIIEIKTIVDSTSLGLPTNFVYHSGQYLPDWHPWEDIRDYYVSNRPTGAAREIVPFELTWLTDIFGGISENRCIYGKTLDLGVDIDDTYAISARFGGQTIGSITVDVTSRVATRRLTLNLERGQVVWDWNEGSIRVEAVEACRSERIAFSLGEAAPGYNRNIIESMYVDEMKAFLSAVRGDKLFPNTLRDDIAILQTLLKLEEKEI
jgi:predicted dehydrogenase